MKYRLRHQIHHFLLHRVLSNCHKESLFPPDACKFVPNDEVPPAKKQLCRNNRSCPNLIDSTVKQAKKTSK